LHRSVREILKYVCILLKLSIRMLDFDLVSLIFLEYSTSKTGGLEVCGRILDSKGFSWIESDEEVSRNRIERFSKNSETTRGKRKPIQLSQSDFLNLHKEVLELEKRGGNGWQENVYRRWVIGKQRFIFYN